MIRTCFVGLILFLTLAGSADAQLISEAAKVRLELQSPHESLRTYLLAMQPENGKVSVAAQTIDFRDINSASAQRTLTKQLKRILDARGLIVNIDHVPRDPEYVDTNSGGNVFYPFLEKEPRIYLDKVESEWRISRFTVSTIPEMYEQLYPYGIDKLVDALPHNGPKFLGYELWQVIGLLVLVVVGIGVGWLLGTVLLWIFGRFFRGWGAYKETAAIIRRAVRPMTLVIGFTITLLFLPALQLPVVSSSIVLSTTQGIIAICIIVIVFRLSDLAWFRLHQRAVETESPLDDALIPLAEKAVKFLIVLAGLFLLLQTWGLDVTALIAGLSIGGVALAFAAQDTIGNLFGSAMIFVDRPFKIGDWIKVDGQDGNVEEIGFRSTRIRTFANSLLTIPNGRLADMTVDNMGLRGIRRYTTTLGLQYNTPPDKVEKFVEQMRKIVWEHPKTVKHEDRILIYFHAYDASSLNVMVYLYFEVGTWREELDARHELNVSFLRLASDLGVSYAFPTRSIHIDSMPPNLAPPPPTQV